MASVVLHKNSERRRKPALPSECFAIQLYVYTINELQSQGVKEINNAHAFQPLTLKEGTSTHGQGCTNPGLSFILSRQVFTASFHFFPPFHTKMYRFTGTGQSAPDKNASKFTHHSRIVGPQNSCHVTVL